MYESDFDFDDNLIKITEYNVKGKLPDPLVFDNGEKVKTKEDWAKRRKEILKYVVDLQYGTMPPKPEFFKVEKTYDSERVGNFRITAGTKEKQVSFMMKIIKAKDLSIPTPIAVDGDLCFNYSHNNNFVDEFIEHGISYVLFNRTELANDVQFEGRRKGPLYDVYPEYTFGSLGAWAWGYSRCLDAIEQIGGYDLSCVAFTGHSRGAKTAMLAGILDERATIVNPNNTNQGSCSCYRISLKAINEDGVEKPSETLKDIWHNFDFWFGEKMGDYIGHEEDLPFDGNFTKAMIAPRVLLVGEAASDIWTNPVGTWQTTLAAKNVFKFLGCEENLLWYFRNGYHFHKPCDAAMLVNVMRHYRYGEELLKERFFKIPFKKKELIF